ncbi:polysaccharide deacetylase [Phreatobacter aquaticus]|uniref:Chitooligosaccharide deacetylase n=1 Tax=Phreatobacter aquaticus TaxID=2570229 RepID=A0A4D7QHD8_9HYPH|nr:polysaccharide deacetylase family protein [Phreatobacter aquaticus]QCK87200.1 polysaccharide deacetylase [Phreatobacter aquaticus]
MRALKTSVYKAGLETLWFTGAHRALRPVFGGVGAILMLHHVRPAEPREFAPNRLLEVTPDYLESVIERVRAQGFETLSLDQACDRLAGGGDIRPFVCFTFDDGYRDNADYAWPILKRHGVPFTLYLPTAFIDQEGELWWLVLEDTIRTQRSVTAQIAGRTVHFDCSTPALKREAWREIYWWLRSLPETELRAYVRDLAARHGLDFRDTCRRLCMTWDEVRALASDPLVTIGAHTVNHYMLAKFDCDTARAEMLGSKDRITSELGREVSHFAYPVGDPTSAGPRDFQMAAECGFRSAVTTRPGLIFPEHRDHLTALPRVSLNGEFQSLRYLDVLLSGAPFAFFNRFRRVNAA